MDGTDVDAIVEGNFVVREPTKHAGSLIAKYERMSEWSHQRGVLVQWQRRLESATCVDTAR